MILLYAWGMWVILNMHGHGHNNVESYMEGCKHLNLAARVGIKNLNIRKGPYPVSAFIQGDIQEIH